MNKVAGAGIIVVVVAIIIVTAVSYSSDTNTTTPGTTVAQVGSFTVESSQEISQEETSEGTDFSVILTEKIGVKTP